MTVEGVTDAGDDVERTKEHEVTTSATAGCQGISVGNSRDESTAESLTTADTPLRRICRVLSHWPIVIGVLLLVFAGSAAGLYFTQYRQDEQKNGAAEKAAIDAASQGSVAVLSYAPATLDHDLAAAKSHLTGNFLTYYSKFVDQIVEPAAKQKAVTTTASVVRAAVSEQHANSAKVLVFLNQTTTSKDRPDPAQTESSVLVSLSKTNGAWSISAFDPL